MKNQTLEEAAHEYFKRGQLGLEKAADTEEAFLRGAKWQQERMYSEEDMIEFAFNTYHYISGLMGVPFNLISENKLHAKYNFEQFKK